MVVIVAVGGVAVGADPVAVGAPVTGPDEVPVPFVDSFVCVPVVPVSADGSAVVTVVVGEVVGPLVAAVDPFEVAAVDSFEVVAVVRLVSGRGALVPSVESRTAINGDDCPCPATSYVIVAFPVSKNMATLA